MSSGHQYGLELEDVILSRLENFIDFHVSLLTPGLNQDTCTHLISFYHVPPLTTMTIISQSL